MNTKYLKNLFTQEEIDRYNFDDDNSDFDKDNFVNKLINEFNKFIENLYKETISYNKSINYFLNQIYIFFKETINLNLTYNFNVNQFSSLKVVDIIFSVISNENNHIDWVITDLEDNFKKVSLYILEINKEIDNYKDDLNKYLYLKKYINITSYEILIHYSNSIY